MSSNSPISKEFGKLLVRLGLKRPRLNFYALRHTFETIGETQVTKLPSTPSWGTWTSRWQHNFHGRLSDVRICRGLLTDTRAGAPAAE